MSEEKPAAAAASSFQCSNCKAVFEFRTALFKHLRLNPKHVAIGANPKRVIPKRKPKAAPTQAAGASTVDAEMGTATATATATGTATAAAADLFNHTTFSDALFTVGSTRTAIPAHRAIIAPHSPVLAAALYSAAQLQTDQAKDVKAPASKDATATSSAAPVKPVAAALAAAVFDAKSNLYTLTIADVEAGVFLALLECLYTDALLVRNGHNASRYALTGSGIRALIAAAQRFGCEAKVQRIVIRELKAVLTISNAAEIFGETAAGLTDQTFALNYICAHASAIVKTDGFRALPIAKVKQIMADSSLMATEIELFRAIVDWGHAQLKVANENKLPAATLDTKSAPATSTDSASSDETALQKLVAPLIPLIRYGFMSVADLAGVVSPANVVPQAVMVAAFQYVGSLNAAAGDATATASIVRAQTKLPFSTELRNGTILKPKLPPAADAKGTPPLISKLVTAPALTQLSAWFNGGLIQLKLLFSGKSDGFRATDFHANCDQKGPLLFVFKSYLYPNVFGAFYDGDWSQNEQIKFETSWLFGFHSATGEFAPVRLLPAAKVRPGVRMTRFGPTFGAEGVANAKDAGDDGSGASGGDSKSSDSKDSPTDATPAAATAAFPQRGRPRGGLANGRGDMRIELATRQSTASFAPRMYTRRDGGGTEPVTNLTLAGHHSLPLNVVEVFAVTYAHTKPSATAAPVPLASASAVSASS